MHQWQFTSKERDEANARKAASVCFCHGKDDSVNEYKHTFPKLGHNPAQDPEGFFPSPSSFCFLA